MTKFRFRVAGFVVGALFCCAVFAASAQNLTGGPAAQPSPATPRPQFFAGTVVELDASHIKVTRTVVGRPTESRSFAINAATKMNKSVIKLHNRVTVRYKRLPEGDVALEIQPRPVVAPTPKV
jgi:hypothetical protein